jgi:predicted O-methyltransferase YrrM
MKITTVMKFVYDILKNPSSLIELNKWWFYYKQKDKSPLNYEIPWMTFKAIDYLSKYLKPEMEIFEWGSGGSTLFFAKRVKKVISIEHDKKWFCYETDLLKKYKNIELHLIEPQKTGIYENKRKEYKGLYFDQYVNSIEKYDKFDVIVIDGRQRNLCLKKAINHIKKGGIIVFDNFDRKYYKKSLMFVNNNMFERIDCYGFVPFGTMQSLTTIFRRK